MKKNISLHLSNHRERENKKSFFSTLIENSDNVPLESHSANEYAVR